MIPYFLLALFSHLNSAFRRVPSAVTPFSIDMQSELFLLALYHFSTVKWHKSWWHNEMEILSTLQALCEGNPSVIGGFPLQRASNVELLIFLCQPKLAVQQTFTRPVISDDDANVTFL